MALRIFDTDTATAADRPSFADDIVGRFRSGYQIDNRPQALGAWRVTSGDPDVADAIQAALGGDAPQSWEAMGEDNLEVFTAAPTIEAVLDGPDAIRQSMVLRNRNGEVIRSSDGEVITYPEDVAGQRDPQADESFADRKAAARSGMGAVPETEITFRLVGSEDLGKFRFKSGSWGLVSDINYFDILGQIAKIAEDGSKVRASLTLKENSFTAKTGPRKGQVVTYTAPVLKVLGAVKG